jgi:hypothetical protein
MTILLVTIRLLLLSYKLETEYYYGVHQKVWGNLNHILILRIQNHLTELLTILKNCIKTICPTLLTHSKFVTDRLGIINSFGDLLPEDKINKVKELKALMKPFVLSAMA